MYVARCMDCSFKIWTTPSLVGVQHQTIARLAEKQLKPLAMLQDWENLLLSKAAAGKMKLTALPSLVLESQAPAAETE